MSVWEKIYKVLAWLKRPKLWGLLAGFLLLAMVVSKIRGPQVPVATVENRILEQKVVMTGRIRSPSRIQMGSPQVGIVARVYVQEGDRVKTGQPLLDLNDAEAKASVDQARALLEQAKARWAQFQGVTAKLASESLRQAQASQNVAQKKLERAQSMLNSGGMTAAEFEAIESEATVANSRLASAQAQALSSSSAGSEARLASAAVLQADAQLRVAQAKLEQLHLLAPCEGVVLKRLGEPGDVVTLGKVLLVLAKDDTVQVTSEPDEKNLALLKPSQKAWVSADAFPSVRLPATVAWVAPAVDPERGTVEVRLEVLERPDFLRPDMTVSIEVDVAQTKTLVVPSEAIKDAATSHPVAWKLENGKLRQVELSLGMQGVGGSQVLKGLSAGDIVVSPYSPSLKEGQRVRPSEASSSHAL